MVVDFFSRLFVWGSGEGEDFCLRHLKFLLTLSNAPFELSHAIWSVGIFSQIQSFLHG